MKMFRKIGSLITAAVIVSTISLSAAADYNGKGWEVLKYLSSGMSEIEVRESLNLTLDDIEKSIQEIVNQEGYSADDLSKEFGIDISKYLTSNSTNIADFTLSGIKDVAYTGKTRTLSIVIKNGSKTLVKGTDYTVTYKNNKSIGKATVVIKGKGKYTGTITKTFKINPKKVTLSTAKATSERKVKLTWKKNTTGAGYLVYYSTEKNGEYKLLKTITKNTTVSYTTKKLSAGKTYYFKVLAYKTVNKVKYKSVDSVIKKVSIPSADGTATVDLYDYDNSLKTTYIYFAEEVGNDVFLYWNNTFNPDICDSVQILRSKSYNSGYKVIATITPENKMFNTGYIDKNAAGKGYYYAVRCVKGSKNGYASIEETVATQCKWYKGEYGYIRVEEENDRIVGFLSFGLNGDMEWNCDWQFGELDYVVNGPVLNSAGEIENVDLSYNYEFSVYAEGYSSHFYLTYTDDVFAYGDLTRIDDDTTVYYDVTHLRIDT